MRSQKFINKNSAANYNTYLNYHIDKNNFQRKMYLIGPFRVLALFFILNIKIFKNSPKNDKII